MKRIVNLLIILSFISCTLSAQESVRLLIEELKNPQSEQVLVVSHRGDWRNAPENSLQAFKNCMSMGVDMIEIDLKMTKDGCLILMHDKTIDRTTNGTGEPKEYTLEEIKKFRLKNGLGRVTPHQIPTLEEVLNLTKGKILINIDKGYDYFNEVYSLLEKTGTTSQAVIKSGFSLEKVRAENGNVLDKVIYMPIINLNAPDAAQQIDIYKAIKPVAIECIFDKVTPEVSVLLQKIKTNGSKVWINSLWPSLNGGHDDDRAVEENQPDETWGWIVSQGATLIQTDRPQLLLQYLKQKGIHNLSLEQTQR